jgi:hypothetical protein
MDRGISDNWDHQWCVGSVMSGESESPMVTFGCAYVDLETGETYFGRTKVEWPDGSVEFVSQHKRDDEPNQR